MASPDGQYDGPDRCAQKPWMGSLAMSLGWVGTPLNSPLASDGQKRSATISRRHSIDRAVDMRSPRRWLAAQSPEWVPLLCVLGAVLVANLPAIAHLVTSNPLVLDSDLASPKSVWLPGLPYIDPNAGYTTQALGHLAALDWLHGHVPWWNPFEGVGSPLAGEMQSGAFFPVTLVLVFHQGMLFLQLILETATGWSTYLLIRKLGVGRLFATSAGVAFGLCGTYAWLAHAPIRPVALLPACLLGIEYATDAASEHRRGGWQLLAVALALSILAGFPETTLIDAIFVGWWAILRLVGPGRPFWRPILGKLGAAVVVGGAMAAPLLVAFIDYLPSADVGAHSGTIAYASLPTSDLTQTILPYSLGPIFAFHATAATSNTISLLWGNVGGFLTVSLIAAGLVGLVGARLRSLRLGLGGWILVCLLRTFGFHPVVQLMAHIPGVRLTAFYRYSNPSWELAVVVLAALGLDDIARHYTSRRAMFIGAIITGALAIWAGYTAWPLLSNATASPGSANGHRHLYVWGSVAAAVLILLALSIGALWAGGRPPDGSDDSQIARRERVRKRGRMLMAAVVGIESMALLSFTYLSAPTPTSIETSSVSWLQAHIGTYRFATLGPIQPDYGSYFGIAEADINDLPLPKAWAEYIHTNLDTNSPVQNFTGAALTDPSGPTAAQELTTHLSDYESVGVRYVIESSAGTDPQGHLFPQAGSPPWPAGPRLVFHDNFAEIWELPRAAPIFSLRTSDPRSCSVTNTSTEEAQVVCSHPSTLIRRVQMMKGWTATFDGQSLEVRPDTEVPRGLFQQVSVPAGTTIVHFTYLPPHEDLGVGTALVGLIVLVISGVVASRARRPSRSETTPTSDGMPPSAPFGG
jgi:hypothetical protein